MLQLVPCSQGIYQRVCNCLCPTERYKPGGLFCVFSQSRKNCRGGTSWCSQGFLRGMILVWRYDKATTWKGTACLVCYHHKKPHVPCWLPPQDIPWLKWQFLACINTGSSGRGFKISLSFGDLGSSHFQKWHFFLLTKANLWFSVATGPWDEPFFHTVSSRVYARSSISIWRVSIDLQETTVFPKLASQDIDSTPCFSLHVSALGGTRTTFPDPRTQIIHKLLVVGKKAEGAIFTRVNRIEGFAGRDGQITGRLSCLLTLIGSIKTSLLKEDTKTRSGNYKSKLPFWIWQIDSCADTHKLILQGDCMQSSDLSSVFKRNLWNAINFLGALWGICLKSIFLVE